MANEDEEEEAFRKTTEARGQRKSRDRQTAGALIEGGNRRKQGDSFDFNKVTKLRGQH